MIRVLVVFLVIVSFGKNGVTQELKSTKTEEITETVYPNYALVVGSFSDVNNAKKFADSVKAKGYDIYFRKSENGSYRICIYTLKSETEAEQRLQKMKGIDSLFYKAWVLGYFSLRQNINYGQL